MMFSNGSIPHIAHHNPQFPSNNTHAVNNQVWTQTGIVKHHHWQEDGLPVEERIETRIIYRHHQLIL